MDDAASSTNGSSSPPNYQNVSDEDYTAQHRLPEILQDVLAEVLKEKPARPIRAIIGEFLNPRSHPFPFFFFSPFLLYRFPIVCINTQYNGHA